MAIASAGGHWLQLRRLAPAFEGRDVFYVSVIDDCAADLPDGVRYYTVPNVTRLNAGNLLPLIPRILGILIKERPSVVVTTGAAPGLVAIAIARCLIGARTIWIDSIANCERMSTSGKFARIFATVCLTQWQHLVEDGGRPSFWGAVL
jgi:hypothetical protein